MASSIPTIFHAAHSDKTQFIRALGRDTARFLDTLWNACYFRLLAAIAEILL
jgi:hypothetical protein